MNSGSCSGDKHFALGISATPQPTAPAGVRKFTIASPQFRAALF